jgi:uncharacterized protein (DUF2267 family)
MTSSSATRGSVRTFKATMRPNAPSGRPSRLIRERLARNEPNNLTNQLPPEIADTLRGEGGRDNFSLEEFYQHVGEKEGVDQDVASRHARAVASVLQEAVTTGEMDDVRGQLKPEYAELSGRYGE